jgi:hypothetical protein
MDKRVELSNRQFLLGLVVNRIAKKINIFNFKTLFLIFFKIFVKMLVIIIIPVKINKELLPSFQPSLWSEGPHGRLAPSLK